MLIYSFVFTFVNNLEYFQSPVAFSTPQPYFISLHFLHFAAFWTVPKAIYFTKIKLTFLPRSLLNPVQNFRWWLRLSSTFSRWTTGRHWWVHRRHFIEFIDFQSLYLHWLTQFRGDFASRQNIQAEKPRDRKPCTYTHIQRLLFSPFHSISFPLTLPLSISFSLSLSLSLSLTHKHIRIFLIYQRNRLLIYYLPTPPLGQDMTQGQFLSGV